MTPTEAAALLAYASAVDNRTVTREAAILWAETLDRHATLEEARAAVTSHFADSTEYLTPAHVNARMRAARRVRSRELPDVDPPRELADLPRLEARWIRAWRSHVLHGLDPDAARSATNEALGVREEPLVLLGPEIAETVRALTAGLARDLATPKETP